MFGYSRGDPSWLSGKTLTNINEPTDIRETIRRRLTALVNTPIKEKKNPFLSKPRKATCGTFSSLVRVGTCMHNSRPCNAPLRAREFHTSARNSLHEVASRTQDPGNFNPRTRFYPARTYRSDCEEIVAR